MGFGLGIGVGAAVGVVQVASAFGISGDPQAAMIGALAGSLVGMVFLLDSAAPQLHWRVLKTSEKFRIEGRSSVVLKLFVNPVTLATLGATIGYNLGKKEFVRATVSVPLFALRF